MSEREALLELANRLGPIAEFHVALVGDATDADNIVSEVPLSGPDLRLIVEALRARAAEVG